MNSVWDWHCGNSHGVFHNLRFLTAPLNARYGAGKSATDYLQKAQVMAYEGHRAMFEGYSRAKYTSTGVIQWMLNNPWPENIWHLYDYYLNQGGSYFGTKKACEPLNIQYTYQSSSVTVVNSRYQPANNLVATADVYSIDATKLYTHSAPVNVPADGVTEAFKIPAISGLGTTYFIRLTLTAANKAVITLNTYWLSTVNDVLDYSRSTFYNTPCTSFADYTGLQKLPKVQLTSSLETSMNGQNVIAKATIGNPSSAIAFFVRLRIVIPAGDVLPIVWDDNYVTLLPSENRTLMATFDSKLLNGATPSLVVEVWNNISGGH